MSKARHTAIWWASWLGGIPLAGDLDEVGIVARTLQRSDQ